MDLIDRQEVISALEKVAGFFPYKEPGNRDSYNEYNEAWNDAIGRAEMEIGKLPSAFGVGHWVEIGDEPYDEWECDECGFTIDGSGCIDPYAYRDIYRFCPHCGCRMVSEEEKDYERAIEDVEYNALYEPTYNQEDGSL